MTRPVAELVELLRSPITTFEDNTQRHYQSLATEAAAALKRLEAENAALRFDLAARNFDMATSRPFFCEHGIHWMQWCGSCENDATQPKETT
jgi:hypothetical protein